MQEEVESIGNPQRFRSYSCSRQCNAISCLQGISRSGTWHFCFLFLVFFRFLAFLRVGTGCLAVRRLRRRCNWGGHGSCQRSITICDSVDVAGFYSRPGVLKEKRLNSSHQFSCEHARFGESKFEMSQGASL